MAHMIDDTTGAPAIAYAGQTPWHGLGRKMGETERRSLPAALKLAGLDWAVERIELWHAHPHMASIQTSARRVPDAYGIVRTDTNGYLGTVGSQFTPIQNVDAFAPLEPLISDFGCTVEVMAALDGGRRTFALVKMPDSTIQVQPGDDVRGYICLMNGHDGSLAHRGILTPIRVVCQNTLSAAQNGKHATVTTVRHTKTAQDRLKQAADIIRRMQAALQETGDTYAQLAQRQMSAKEIAAYIETVIPAPKDTTADALSKTIKDRREAIADLIFHGTHTQDGGADARSGQATAWRAYNAVTEYFDHTRVREAKSQTARDAARDSALFGANANIKAQALRVLLAAA